MEKKERSIFDTRVKGLLDSMVLNARNEAVATGFYSLNHAPLEIEKAKGEIFDKVFKWPSINLLRNTLKFIVIKHPTANYCL